MLSIKVSPLARSSTVAAAPEPPLPSAYPISSAPRRKDFVNENSTERLGAPSSPAIPRTFIHSMSILQSFN
jgi:hypothetical protein